MNKVRLPQQKEEDKFLTQKEVIYLPEHFFLINWTPRHKKIACEHQEK